MIYEVVIHHFSATATLILWLSLVALSDPYPFSGGTEQEVIRNSSVVSTELQSELSRNTSERYAYSSTGNLQNVPITESTIPFLPTKKYFPFKSTLKTDTMKIGSNNLDPIYNLSDKTERSLQKKRAQLVFPVATPAFSSKRTQLILRLDRDYTPDEIADYIFHTGDEKGFSQVIAEMVQDGEIMESKDDVILFLEAVQLQLAKLRSHSQKSTHQEQLSLLQY